MQKIKKIIILHLMTENKALYLLDIKILVLFVSALVSFSVHVFLNPIHQDIPAIRCGLINYK